jgi:hypothetical protein
MLEYLRTQDIRLRTTLHRLRPLPDLDSPFYHVQWDNKLLALRGREILCNHKVIGRTENETPLALTWLIVEAPRFATTFLCLSVLTSSGREYYRSDPETGGWEYSTRPAQLTHYLDHR